MQKRLPNIDIPKQDLKKIIEHPFDFGGEALICHGYDNNTLYKIFSDCKKRSSFSFHHLGEISTMPDSKFQKIKMLYEMQLPNSVIPVASITYNRELIGYEMTYDKDDVPLSRPKNYENRAEIIRQGLQSQEILEMFSRRGVVYGDVATRNILFNLRTAKLKFCDMDNAQIGYLPIEAKDYFLDNYIFERKGVDSTVDAYMHNIMIMNQLGVELYDCLLSDDYFLEEFDEKALPILEGMRDIPNFNGEYAVQYVKKKVM